jgi:nucleoside-diphosphate-sugar epimerase
MQPWQRSPDVSVPRASRLLRPHLRAPPTSASTLPTAMLWVSTSMVRVWHRRDCWLIQRRVPSVAKAKEHLDFEATTTLDEILDEVVPWVVAAIELGLI